MTPVDGGALVLAALREAASDFVSGEALSTQLGVSRAQIWKHVAALRRRGYTIEGERGGGYRLMEIPDRLYPEEIWHGLATRWLGRRLQYLESVDSTNRVAQELGRAGAEHGTAVVAEAQTAGRGRLGRSFYSPPGLNLYTSIVLRPSLTLAQAPTLILAAGVAVADTVAEYLDRRDALQLKWPNDVLLDGLKTSGILMELASEETRVSHAVLGIGVNLNVEREQFPDEFRRHATSLRAHCGRRIDRVDFTRRLYGNLERVLDLHDKGGFTAVRPGLEAWFRMEGRTVSVREMSGHEISGRVAGLALDGALELETAGGELIRVIAGDVTLAKPEGTEESSAP